MDKLLDALPQIISAAAASQLGILALLSVALAVLAYVFFASASEKVRVGIFVLLFLGAVGFGAAMFRATPSPPPEPADPPGGEGGATAEHARRALLALREAGVDYSTDAVEEWVANDSTPYPAVSAALLRLLGGRRLARPVYLDVVVYNYERAAGADRPIGALDAERLRAAVVEGYNTRHGAAARTFDELLR